MIASVIVVSYNRGKLLSKCVDRLLDQSVDDYEVIVVDDGSIDETEEIMRKKKDRRFKYFKNYKKKGQPVARNSGISKASGEIIIFVDSDVLVDDHFVEDHIRHHGKNDRLIVQGMVRHIRDVEDYGIFTLKIDGLCLSGLITQNVSIRKNWILNVGGFDESFGDTMGYMDVELGRRLKKAGLRTVYAWRSCYAWHVDGYETEERLRSVFSKAYQRGMNAVRFSRMYGSKVAARHLKKNYVWFITKLFGTEHWVEKKGIEYVVSHRDDFLFPILKWIVKYHFRMKGIKESLNNLEKSETD